MIERNVAVVIPLYNHEKYIEYALQSVVEQSYRVSEIVIVDDGSTDNSFQIARKILSGKEGVILKRQKNSGTASALNNAIAATSCEWIAVLNSDDIFDLGKIERCLELTVSNPNLEIISGNLDFIDHNGSLVEDGVSRDWLKRSFAFYQKTQSLPLSILHENFIATSSNIFFKKVLWERVGGFRDYRYCNDLDFLIRCFEHKSFYFDLEHKHLSYRTHSSNTIAEDIAQIRLERAFVTMKHLARLKIEDAQIPFLFEAIRNLKLGEMMFILNLISKPSEEDFLDWLKVKEIVQDKGLLKIINF
jgi:glycosyltransferase involved in cell wall biosynthesis